MESSPAQPREPATLRTAVREAYSAVAESPSAKHSFPVGRQFAQSIGYPVDLLDSLPLMAVEAFAGVSNVSVFAEIPDGATVLDFGCGAGLDSLIAARRVGPEGKVVGIDFSEAMIDRARTAATKIGARNVDFRLVDAEEIPLPDDSVDVAMVNGLFNLSPCRSALFREFARVMRPGANAFVAELILLEPLPPEERACVTNWFK